MNNPRVERADYISPDRKIVSQAVTVLTAGGLVVAPTETRYGLLARADRPRTLENLYNIKRRPVTLPTAIFVSDLKDISMFGELNRTAARLARRFLPGPLTLVLKAVQDLGKPLVVDGKIGIRWSSAPFIRMLFRAIDFPVTATSANPSGKKECDTIDEIVHIWGNEIDLYIDSGILGNTVSTVIDVACDSPVVLREGAISADEIAKVLKSQFV